MSELKLIEAALKKAASRRRWLNLWRGFWIGLLIGGGCWALSIGAYKLFPLPEWTALAGACVGGAVVLVSMAWTGWKSSTLQDTARWVDQRQNLKERLSSALELADKGDKEWENLLIADAARHAKEIDVKRMLPFTLPTMSRWAVLVLVLGAGLGFVPEYRTQEFMAGEKEKETIKETGKQLAALTRRQLAAKPPGLEATEKALQEVTDVGDLLGKVSLSKTDALENLADVAKRLGDELDQLKDNPSLNNLRRAAQQPAAGQPALSPKALAEEIESMERALGDAAGQEEGLEDLQDELEEMTEAAKGMASDGSEGQNGAAKAAMAKALAGMAQQARDMGAALPDLEDAIKALEAGNTDLFLSEMGAAMNDLEELKEMAQSLQQMQQQQARVGKDLPEQLKNGQGQAAQSTLRDMMDKVSSQLSEEQLESILNELERSVQPGSKMGDVGQHLKKAAEQLQSGDKTGANQSMAEAIQELDKLMNQMADAEGLESAMQSLARAEQAIAQGKSWSDIAGKECSSCQGGGCQSCNGQGKKFGTRPGRGRGGAGVGTWADDPSSMSYFKSDEMVDNSGIQRPDMAARGLADRGDGELNPGLIPDKVRGKIAPGSSMPSITLKGVSIRGASRVQYEEAAAAAQNDARSALNQDQVPRAYRGAVRDYFDEFKR